MAEHSTDGKRPGFLRRTWEWFWRPSSVLSFGFVMIAGFVAGVLFWGGFHWALEETNTEEFCTSCHTMTKNFDEYTETVHYNNHSGVRATCPDCHVPHEWQHKVKAKIMASKDVYHELMGTIDTDEKYDERRLHMASAVWTKMKKTDSRECRNCHAFEFMDFTIQETRAAAEHQKAIDESMTCIDCHQGIAHGLPAGYLEEYRRVVDEMASTEADGPVTRVGMIDPTGLGSAIRGYLSGTDH
ncbi:NapC/NirT family cytochrome c [Tropicimonas sediminicola]|uniref:Cytochrome c-type protein NapC n=1 Tax=Tropicimonas sediminicola TaxID=1031541 RepID=A0A239F418_9RHOB|nr:NapC/NirT family cytochrome c [Tropicimonas sediminicola]SNS51770.1 cytochrome c-type protein NapC [Tropicimonas sediminicola]